MPPDRPRHDTRLLAEPDFRDVDPRLLAIARTVRAAGGRALFVGGQVRDRLLGRSSTDVDMEVFGLGLEEVETVLGSYGRTRKVGRSFGVIRVDGLDADFSLPRRDNKTGRGHRGFSIDIAPDLDFTAAARRRDFRVNSMGFDPLTGEVLDPHDGRADLAAGRLRATDRAHFAEDPLRGLRAAQFAARFELEPDGELVALAARLDLGELAAERVYAELRKLLLLGVRPAIGFAFLRTTGLVRFFPEVEALIGVPQDPRWHPEGDVWNHTLMALDRAADLRRGDAGDEPLMFAVLCHDFGKPAATTEALRSPGHDREGVEPAQRFLRRLRAPGRLTEQVCALVRDHLAPARFVRDGAGPSAYRRLARRLDAAGADLELLARVATADHLGRTTRAAREGRFREGSTFLERARAALPGLAPAAPAVLGRHLIARGFEPGPQLGRLLAACRKVQDETGWSDPDSIIDRALGGTPEPPDP
ncbi:MAG: HD domain-containing protein [Immundisolibacterales bacterium]|nr:HD domain-containing protein [Immundisolibacterales bacterium]